jgi:hypothetical protein
VGNTSSFRKSLFPSLLIIQDDGTSA